MTDVAANYAQIQATREKQAAEAAWNQVYNTPEPTSNTPVAAPSVPSQDGTLKGMAKGLVGGVAGGVKHAMDSIDDAANFLNDHLLNLRTDSQQRAYEANKAKGVREDWGGLRDVASSAEDFYKTDTMSGNLTKGITEFAVGFIPGLKATKMMGVGRGVTAVGGKVAGIMAEGATAGSIATMTTVDPDSGRLSDLLVKMPWMNNSVTQYLASDPNDSDATKRFKNTLENGLLGIAADGAIQLLGKAITAYRATKLAQGLNPADEIQSSLSHLTTTTTESTTAQQVAKQDAVKGLDDIIGGAEKAQADGIVTATIQQDHPAIQAMKEMGHLDANAEQVGLGELKAAREKLASAAKAEELAAFRRENPTTSVLADPAYASVAPVVTKRTPKINEATADQIVNTLVKGDIKEAAKVFGDAFNPAYIDSSEDVKGLMDVVAGKMTAAFEKAGAGTHVSNADTDAFAMAIGGSAETLKKQYQGSTQAAARFLAHRNMIAMSAQKAVEMAQAAKELLDGVGNHTFASAAERDAAIDAAQLAVKKQLLVHSEMQAQLNGIQTEYARALQAMRITSSGEKAMQQQMKDLVEGMGGRMSNQDFIEKLASLKSTAEINQFCRKSAWKNTWDTATSVWINSILSGPVTHAANIIGNSLRAAAGVAETANAAIIKGIRKGEMPNMAETTAQAWGMLEGLGDALGISSRGVNLKEGFGVQSLVKDQPTSYSGAYVGTTRDAGAALNPIKGANYGISNPTLSKTTDMLGTVVTLPGRFLQAEDALFFTINYRGELRKQAYLMAKGEGLAGEELTQRIATLMNPDTMPESLNAAAQKAGREGTFTQNLDPANGYLDQVALGVGDIKRRIPATNFIVPFVRTPTNMMRYTYDRFPLLNLMQESNRAILKQGGAAADQLMAQWTLGGAMLSMGWYLSSQGIITGGDNLNSKGTDQVSGVQKYSIKVGDTYYSYNRLDPIGMFLGLAADTADITGNLDDNDLGTLSGAIVMATSKNLMSKSYLQGLTQFFGVVNDVTRSPVGEGSESLNRYLRGLATGFIPLGSLANQTNRSLFDNQMKEVHTMAEAFRSRIPGMSDSVLPQRDILTGEPLVFKGGLGPDMVSPIYKSIINQDPVAQEIARLNLPVQKPSMTVGKFQLTPEQYDQYQINKTQVKYGGKTMHERLTDLITSPKWEQMSERQAGEQYDGAKEKAIKEIMGFYDQAALAKLRKDDPDLNDALKEEKGNSIRSLLGRPISHSFQ